MATLFYFENNENPAQQLAQACGLSAACISVHRFPDDELRLQLPVDAQGRTPTDVVLYLSLDHPNDKLIELLLATQQAKALGTQRILLVAPYLAYMRQDIAFHPGEVVSQRIIGQFLAGLVDGLITVDPHLHRISRLDEAVPLPFAQVVSGADILAQYVQHHHAAPILIGPDGESEQWVAQAAQKRGWTYGVCQKVRHGDHEVTIELPPLPVRDHAVVLLDDIASSGRTLAKACELLLAAGAASVDVAVTHALFAHDALDVIHGAGVRRVWSTDCVPHSSNTIAIAPALAPIVQEWLAR